MGKKAMFPFNNSVSRKTSHPCQKGGHPLLDFPPRLSVWIVNKNPVQKPEKICNKFENKLNCLKQKGE